MPAGENASKSRQDLQRKSKGSKPPQPRLKVFSGILGHVKHCRPPHKRNWENEREKKRLRHTKMVFPLYSKRMDDRPTSFPAPRGVSRKKSFSSATGTSISALRFTPAIDSQHKRRGKKNLRKPAMGENLLKNAPDSFPEDLPQLTLSLPDHARKTVFRGLSVSFVSLNLA